MSPVSILVVGAPALAYACLVTLGLYLPPAPSPRSASLVRLVGLFRSLRAALIMVFAAAVGVDMTLRMQAPDPTRAVAEHMKFVMEVAVVSSLLWHSLALWWDLVRAGKPGRDSARRRMVTRWCSGRTTATSRVMHTVSQVFTWTTGPLVGFFVAYLGSVVVAMFILWGVPAWVGTVTSPEVVGSHR